MVESVTSGHFAHVIGLVPVKRRFPRNHVRARTF